MTFVPIFAECHRMEEIDISSMTSLNRKQYLRCQWEKHFFNLRQRSGERSSLNGCRGVLRVRVRLSAPNFLRGVNLFCFYSHAISKHARELNWRLKLSQSLLGSASAHPWRKQGQMQFITVIENSLGWSTNSAQFHVDSLTPKEWR